MDKKQTMQPKELNHLDRINNVLITHAYHIADDIRQEAKEIQDKIRENQPTNNVKNKPLIIGVNQEIIISKAKLLKELERLSVYCYRVNAGLDKPDNITQDIIF